MRKKRSSIATGAIGMFIAVLTAAVFITGISYAGSLEPSSDPAPTMRTLDEVYSAKTWSRKLSCDTPADCPRFEVLADFNNEAVLDKETGLVWAKSPDPTKSYWQPAANYCVTANIGGRNGWRLPTIEELTSLVDSTQASPALPSGHPFLNLQAHSFWSSTLYGTYSAWYVDIWLGTVSYAVLSGGSGGSITSAAWPVRGGQ